MIMTANCKQLQSLSLSKRINKLSAINRKHLYTCNTIDESQNIYAEKNKSEKEEYLLYESI